VFVVDANSAAPPVFSRGEYFGRVLENSPSQTVVLQVNATVKDVDRNSAIRHDMITQLSDVLWFYK